MMSNKVILVIVDGLKYQTSLAHCGFLEGQVEAGKARRWRMRASLPSMSAPCYQSILSGLSPADHGVTVNQPLAPSTVANIFSEAQAAHKVTGAVAYSWFSVLFNGHPYEPARHHETDDKSKPIQHGRFYDNIGMSDFHLGIPSDTDLCGQVDGLILCKAPDFMLLHTLSCDSVGHVYGGSSWQYARSATIVDTALAGAVPGWRKEGYRVLVTADHGFTDCGYHGGTSDDVRDVAFYDIGHPDGGIASDEVSQRAIAPTVLAMLGLVATPGMTEPTLV
jgi:predicted AlkP superfamily pyrophosphatase or phosphodiesterase